MKVAHLADSHLGFRQYDRATPQGINLREADVARAWHAAHDGIIAWQPDVIVHAGDFFHAVRPPNTAVVDALRELKRVRAALPGVPYLIINGNHDQPRSSDAGNILRALAEVEDVHVATAVPMRFTRDGIGVLAVPHAAWSRPDLAITPDPAATVNLCVLHGEVQGLDRRQAALEGGGATLPAQDEAGWDYVALGHYHVPTRIGPRTFYAGATEYVSTNPWEESQLAGLAPTPGGKGWLAVELEAGHLPAVTFHPVPTRLFVDLPRLDAAAMSPAELTAALGAGVGSLGDLDGVVVRQVVANVAADMKRHLDWPQIRAWKAQATHYQLRLDKPERTLSPAVQTFRGLSMNALVAQAISGRPVSETMKTRMHALADETLAAVAAEEVDGE